MSVVPIPLGPWLPDLPLLGNQGISRAFNVLPGNGAYLPMLSEALFSSTTAGKPLGATSGLDPNGNAAVFMGDSNTLYQLDANTKAWSDVSRAGGYSTAEGERWRFAEFGRLQVAVNFNDYIQAYDKQTSTRFDNLTTLVRARYVMALDNFLVVANTFDALDGAQSGRVRWSGINEAAVWTYSPDTMSDFQDILGYGKITGLAAMGEDGIILLENAIFRMTFVPGPSIFEFKPIILGKGCTVPNSVITVEGKIFFLSSDGFYMLDGGQITNIGEGKINSTFLNGADTTDAFANMSVEADPTGKIIYWLYRSTDAITPHANRYIILNYVTGQWSEGDSGAVSLIFRSMSLATTMEQLHDTYGEFAAIPASLDSLIWSGGRPFLAGLNNIASVYSMSGAQRPATLVTSEMETANLVKAMDPNVVGERTLIRAIRPLVITSSSAAIQARVISRNYLQQVPNSSAFTSMTVRAECPQRVDSRYQRIELSLTGDWQQAMAVQIDAVCTGSR